MKKRALISVSDKRDIVAFAQFLTRKGYEILSTGGTAKALLEAGISVISIEEITGFPECFGGRVKTMHPLIMGGILHRRGNSDDVAEAQKNNINAIDLVIVNLYPFEETANKYDVSTEELIEQIDIGGPTLLRSAAKNYQDVVVICDPNDYQKVQKEMEAGDVSIDLREELACKVFLRTAAYDACIARVLSGGEYDGVMLTKGTELRYGENPHQWGKFYDICGAKEQRWVQHQGKELSYLNILDADGAWNLVCEFDRPTAACIKHANPSGVASAATIEEAFQQSYDADRLSAFGVIISLNQVCTKEIVEKLIDQKIFVEVLIAPSFASDALELLITKPKIRVIEHACPASKERPIYRSMMGGMLVQNIDDRLLTKEDLQCVTEKQPTPDQIGDLLFAWKVVKHAKSNAIVFAKNSVTVGIGCGQTSRVDSTQLAAKRGGERCKGAVMASDAFFPFADSIEEAAKNGIAAIVQPGGSIRDEEIIAKANELEIPMMVTGVRGFRH